MPINSSIYNQIQQPKIINPVNALAEVEQLRGLQSQNALSGLKMDEYRRGVEQSNAERQAYANNTDPKARLEALAKVSPKGYQAEAKFQTEQQKAQRENEKAQIEGHLQSFEAIGRIMSTVRDQATYDMARQEVARVIGPEAAARQPAVYDPVAMEDNRVKAMSVKDRMVQRHQELTLEETTRHHTATEKQGAERLAHERSQPRGQVFQSDQGVMLVDPRSGTAKPVTANGQPLQPKLKDLPAPISKALMENNTSLRKIDQALQEVDAYPDALGVKNYLGDTIRQRSDPQGVNARALVADIGSLKIHDRSGAAVTAAETPRLKPFIPSATDDPATVKKKLNLFKQEYQAIQDDINSTYTREQGYNQRGTVTKPATAPASNIDDLLKKYGG